MTMVMTVGSFSGGDVDESRWPREESGRVIDPYAVIDFIRFEPSAR